MTNKFKRAQGGGTVETSNLLIIRLFSVFSVVLIILPSETGGKNERIYTQERICAQRHN